MVEPTIKNDITLVETINIGIYLARGSTLIGLQWRCTSQDILNTRILQDQMINRNRARTLGNALYSRGVAESSFVICMVNCICDVNDFFLTPKLIKDIITSRLNSPFNVGHGNILKLKLILIVAIIAGSIKF